MLFDLFLKQDPSQTLSGISKDQVSCPILAATTCHPRKSAVESSTCQNHLAILTSVFCSQRTPLVLTSKFLIVGINALISHVRLLCFVSSYASVPSNTQGGGRFNESQSKSDIEWKIHRAKEIPGPGEYVVKTPENKGGRFNESRPMSDVDVMISRAASLPGPGEYASSPQKMSGGKFNMSNPKSDIDVLIYEAAQSPGPSDYIVKDDIVRQSSHTGKFPFVYRPENAKLKKFARAVNTIRTMNRFKEMGALQKLMEVSNMDEKGAKLKKAETEASLSLIVDNTPPISPTPCPVKGEGKEDTMEVKENAEEKEA